MKKKNYVRKPWAFEEETLDTVRSLAQALIDCTLSIRKIEEMLTPFSGMHCYEGAETAIRLLAVLREWEAYFSICEGQGAGRGAPHDRNL